jgi:aminoglycoside phosphotransferase (APT) family kinase protein
VLGQDHADEIARLFGLGAQARFTGRVGRGEQGSVEELVAGGDSFAVKVSFDAPDLDGEDAEFQTAARAAGVPTPAVLATVDGDWHADIDGMPVRLSEWVDLLPAESSHDPAEAGRVVATIHRTPFRGRRGEDPWYTDPVGAAAWDALCAGLAAASAPFAADLAGMRDELVALEALLTRSRTLQTCHRDLWAENLRPTQAGGLCVIDWENCGLADPGQELSGVIFEFGCGDMDRVREVYGAYRRAGGPATVSTRADFSMTIAQLGHITEAACRIWLAAGVGSDERARQEARVGEAVEQPLTLEVIDELLETVRGVPV